MNPTPSTDWLGLIPEKYHGLILFLLAVSPYVTRGLHALMNGRGLKGLLSAIWLGTNTPARPADTKAPAAAPLDKALGWVIVLLLALSLAGCGHAVRHSDMDLGPLHFGDDPATYPQNLDTRNLP